MEYLIGIDVGTTGTKSTLFSIDGDMVDISYRGYELSYPHEGWVEQNPDDWWNALIGTVKDITTRNRCEKDVVAMSLSTQGGALVLLDEHFNSICPSVSWLDTRANETTEQLLQKISIEELYKMSGWPIKNGLNFPVIFWFKEKQPELYENARFFASTIDYINYLLTGRFVIDYSNLALTMFLDLNKRDISDSALHIAGIDRSSVPEVLPSGQVIGKLTKEAVKKLGLSQDVVVVSGAHDQYCANIGAGAQSKIWLQIVADVCNIQVSLPEISEAACAGAAVLAGTGSGIFHSIEEASKKVTKDKSIIIPNQMNSEVYKELYQKFVLNLEYV